MADGKIADQTNNATPASTLIVYLTDGSGTVDYKATLANLAASSSWSAIYATITSPTFLGVPAGPTAAGGTSTTQLATTAFVAGEIATLVGTAPGVLNTLGEISDAINDDANLYTTLVTAIAAKVSDVAYDATTWNGETGVAPSKNAVRDMEEARAQISTGTRWTADAVTTPGVIYGNVSLSGGIAFGDTLTGGTGASEALWLSPTAHATKGSILLYGADITYTATPLQMFGLETGRVITANFSSPKQPAFIRDGSTRVMNTAGNAAANASVGFDWAVIYKNTNAVTVNLAASSLGVAQIAYFERQTIQADGATINAGISYGLRCTPTFSVLNSGVLTASYKAVGTGGTIGTGTTLTYTHLDLVAPTVTGTLSEQIGLNVPILTGGSSFNIGIRNASTSVKTPTANTAITAVSGTIAHTAAVMTITADASYTLTSAPTISDGQPGEELIILNVDTTDTITIQDQGTLAGSNLRLVGTNCALGPRDSIRLIYNSTVGDWVEIGRSNVT